ncbi:MAG: SDR family NAD(P)-dependent oxidoreductase [Acidimicrobiales bacterium]|nr:SDR family NAD(P)-dependent oxidoreductase [Acidimicrobiales bacterium]
MNDSTSMPQNVVVLGGTSEIATHTLRLLSGRRLKKVLLVGRNKNALESSAMGLESLGVDCAIHVRDTTDIKSASRLEDAVKESLDTVDLVLVATGMLGSSDFENLGPLGVAEIIETNFVGPSSELVVLADILKRQGFGSIVIISSVAGVRVRKDNFIYGSAKAGLDAFAQGLSQCLAPHNIRVTIVRFGFVRTRMTKGLKDAPMTIDVDTASSLLVAAIEKGKTGVVWIPSNLKFLFAILRALPTKIWWKLSERS